MWRIEPNAKSVGLFFRIARSVFLFWLSARTACRPASALAPPLLAACGLGQHRHVGLGEESVEAVVALNILVHQPGGGTHFGENLLEAFLARAGQVQQKSLSLFAQGFHGAFDVSRLKGHMMAARAVVVYEKLGGAAGLGRVEGRDARGEHLGVGTGREPGHAGYGIELFHVDGEGKS